METTTTAAEAKVTPANEDVVAENRPDCPTFTLQANSAFGISCMIAVRDIALERLPRDEQQVIAAKLREFELHEEANSGRAV